MSNMEWFWSDAKYRTQEWLDERITNILKYPPSPNIAEYYEYYRALKFFNEQRVLLSNRAALGETK